jgi:hypothetical protein
MDAGVGFLGTLGLSDSPSIISGCKQLQFKRSSEEGLMHGVVKDSSGVEVRKVGDAMLCPASQSCAECVACLPNCAWQGFDSQPSRWGTPPSTAVCLPLTAAMPMDKGALHGLKSFFVGCLLVSSGLRKVRSTKDFLFSYLEK